MLKFISCALAFSIATLSAMSDFPVENYEPQTLKIQLHKTSIQDWIHLNQDIKIIETSAFNLNDPTLKTYCAFLKDTSYDLEDPNRPSPIFICTKKYRSNEGFIEIILGVGYFFQDFATKNESMFFKILNSFLTNNDTYYLYDCSKNCFNFYVNIPAEIKKQLNHPIVYKEAIFINRNNGSKILVQKIINSNLKMDVLLSFSRHIQNESFTFFEKFFN